MIGSKLSSVAFACAVLFILPFGVFIIARQMWHIGTLETALTLAKSQSAMCEAEVKTLKSHILASSNQADPTAAASFNGQIRAPPPILPGGPSSCSPATATQFHAFRVCSRWFEGLEAQSKALPLTLVTQLSVDRLPSLGRLLDSWQAPVSAALYVSQFDAQLRIIRDFLKGNEAARRWLRLSLLFQKGNLDEAYPIQTLRNLAMRLGHGALFLVDVDFIPSPNLPEKAVARLRLYSQARPGVKVAFVVPAFEPTKQRSTSSRLPAEKETLLIELKAGMMRPILGGQHASHITTNFAKYESATQDYAIEYEVLYEPYVIATTPGIPVYDERFNEYGNDKCAQIYEMAAARYQFVVVADAFIIHMGHGEADWKQVTDVDKSWKQWGEYMKEIEARYSWRPEIPQRLIREVDLGYLPGGWMRGVPKPHPGPGEANAWHPHGNLQANGGKI